MGIILPDLFEQKLQTNRELRSAVDGTIADFDPWLKDSKLPFFVDYTDHGVDHLSQVLETARHLIPLETVPLVSAADVAVLAISILLHDSAMHLSEAGFETLIRGERKPLIRPFDTATWSDLWDNFMFSAKRWDERKLIDVFGEIEPGVPRAAVRDPFEHYSNLTESDRRVIGEFIRANHPRMAHEFALSGVPGASGQTMTIANRMEADLRDIAGLVARSHGLPVRPCVDYLLQKGYHKREYQSVHAPYLMVLLRISDILQIQKERAHPISFKYKHIPSRVSTQEWKAHNAITNITQTHDDPESLEVQALPYDIGTFLRLKDWLSSMQSEFDASWAVLGEIYGSQTELRKLGLILRRVRSNLDEPKSLLTQINYVPERIEFNVARPQLLKLLVRPLYGNRPQIGVRELIQNSVDAVRELMFLRSKYPEFQNTEVVNQESDVDVWLDDPDDSGYAWLTVSDRGIGMNEDIVKDYFLMAGASFRQSDAWQREFEIDQQPGKFRTQVLRAGRFGVGALAAFLLTDEIHVETRRAGAAYGFRFSSRLDADPIQLQRDESLPTGTTIRMKVPLNVYQELTKSYSSINIPWGMDWFCLDYPKVIRRLGEDRTILSQSYTIPTSPNGNLENWRMIDDLADYHVYWSFDEAPSLICNGIFITNSAVRSKFSSIADSTDMYYGVSHPNIVVNDPDGNFPLNLQRNAISTDRYEFEDRLINLIIEDFIAFLLVNAPKSFSARPYVRKQYKGINSGEQISNRYWYGGFGQSFLHKEGLSIFDPLIMSELKIASALYLLESIENDRIRSNNDVLFSPVLKYNESTLEFFLERCKRVSIGFKDTKVVGVRAVINNDLVSDSSSKKTEQELNLLKTKRSKLRDHKFAVEAVRGKWAVVATKDCPPSSFSFTKLGESAYRDVAIIELYPGSPAKKNAESFRTPALGLVGDIWNRIIGQPCIPFDPKARETIVARAPKTFQRFVELTRSERNQY